MAATRAAGASAAPPSLPADEPALDDLLSRPRAETVEALAACPGDVVVLGAGGKMGPTLSRLVARAAAEADAQAGRPVRRVIAVSRFSSPAARLALEAVAVETLPCDLLDRRPSRDYPTPRTSSSWPARSSGPARRRR